MTSGACAHRGLLRSGSWSTGLCWQLLLAGSLSVTSYAVSMSRGWVGAQPGSVRFLLDALQFLLVAGGVAALYRYVPNTQVRWTHACVGGLFVATGLELAKSVLAWYLGLVPTYSVVYGAFATVPILLVWIYLLWVIVLLGAVVTAYLPSLLSGIARRGDGAGWNFQLALEVLDQLREAGRQPVRGLALDEIARRLRVDPLQLEEPVAVLIRLDWVARLDEGQERYVLMADLESTPLAPLAERLLLAREPGTQAFWSASRMVDMPVADALQRLS